MPVTHARIDERLIHGQVTVRWTKEYPVNTIVVANDEAAADEMQMMLLPLSAPSGVQTKILPVEEAAPVVTNDLSKRNVFLVVKRPADALRLIDLGLDLPEINVGNMSHRSGSRQIKKSVSVTDDDVAAFEELNRRGVRLTGRMMPEESERDFMEYLGG